jgi:hypothetical protein
MPRAFGSFIDSPTLDCVCDECNGHFGETIERELGRDSLEALLRILNKTKPASDAHELGYSRGRMSLEHEDANWKGCHLVWRDDNGEPGASLVPQVGFRRRDRDAWVFVLERDLEDTDKPLPPEAADPRKGLLLISSTRETTERLMAVLARRGIAFQRTRQTEGRLSSADGVAHVTLHGSIDETSFRCVGKIAFNYLAWRVGAVFVRGESFNRIRAYVRYGTLAPPPLVRASADLILADDTMENRQTNGHMVTAAWTTGNKYLVGQVSLFNSIKYSVSLARDFVGVWLPMAEGHHFDHQTGAITRLFRMERA